MVSFKVTIQPRGGGGGRTELHLGIGTTRFKIQKLSKIFFFFLLCSCPVVFTTMKFHLEIVPLSHCPFGSGPWEVSGAEFPSHSEVRGGTLALISRDFVPELHLLHG